MEPGGDFSHSRPTPARCAFPSFDPFYSIAVSFVVTGRGDIQFHAGGAAAWNISAPHLPRLLRPEILGSVFASWGAIPLATHFHRNPRTSLPRLMSVKRRSPSSSNAVSNKA